MSFQILFFTLLLLLSIPLCGQQNNIYTDLYSTYFNNLSIINPAFLSPEGKVELIANFKNRTGPFRKIATYSFSAGRIFRKENNAAHAARIIFWNEREGPYIQKPRGYANYAFSLPLSENLNLSAGVSLGFTQVSFNAPSSSGIGSAVLPDGALGILLQGKRISAGVSSMQLFNARSEAINASIRLSRFYTFFCSAEKPINAHFKIKWYALYRLLPDVFDNADLTLAFDYKSIISFGASARYRQGLSFFTSWNIRLGKDRLLVCFAYNSPLLNKNGSLVNSIELTSGYLIY